MRPYVYAPGVTMSAIDKRIWAVIERYYPKHTEAYVSAGTDGTHVAHSYHYQGLAIDIGTYADSTESQVADQAEMDDLALWLYKNFGDLSAELIHCAPSRPHQYTYIKNGQPVAPYGPASEHINHIHWAVTSVNISKVEQRAAARFAANPALPTAKPAFPLPAGQSYGIGHHDGTAAADQPAIRLIQRALHVKVDGGFGDQTDDAVRAFQRSHNLKVDGLVGSITGPALGIWS